MREFAYMSAISISDFYAYMPQHKYMHTPTRELWPASSVDSRLPDVPLSDGKTVRPSAWLDKNRPVEQMTWAPGLPEIIADQFILVGGWIDRPGARVFNLYRAPVIRPGDPTKAQPWIDHVNYVYPEDADHIIKWLAQRVQRPQNKINHAIVLGGDQGIGKDTLLAPVKYAIGPWNFQEVSPQQVMGRFCGFLNSVILRISEARDLGESDRFKFYDHTKSYIAAPPETLRVDEKNTREYNIPNCCGVIITTNHKTDGIFLSPDDRRHYVAWSPRQKEDALFQGNYWKDLWGYYEDGGFAHVAVYLVRHGRSVVRDRSGRKPHHGDRCRCDLTLGLELSLVLVLAADLCPHCPAFIAAEQRECSALSACKRHHHMICPKLHAKPLRRQAQAACRVEP
jgi:hypothetical protein